MSTHQHEFSGQVNWGMEDVVGFSASALPSACDSLPTTGIPGQILSHASAKPVSQSSFGLGGREMYSKEQWEIQKPVIYRLYNQENKSFKRVVEILGTEHNFFPTYVILFLLFEFSKSDCLFSLTTSTGEDNSIARLVSGGSRRTSKRVRCERSPKILNRARWMVLLS